MQLIDQESSGHWRQVKQLGLREEKATGILQLWLPGWCNKMEVDFLGKLLECVGPMKVSVLCVGVGVCLWLCMGLGDEHVCACMFVSVWSRGQSWVLFLLRSYWPCVWKEMPTLAARTHWNWAAWPVSLRNAPVLAFLGYLQEKGASLSYPAF